jgi:hypothetical protein
MSSLFVGYKYHHFSPLTFDQDFHNDNNHLHDFNQAITFSLPAYQNDIPTLSLNMKYFATVVVTILGYVTNTTSR